MAQALKKHTAHLVFGADRCEETLRTALSEGCIDGALTEQTIARCDLLFIALYPQAAIDTVKKWAAQIKRGACVVDLCGVKRAIEDTLAPLAREHGFLYIGGHPMAGREVSGYTAARADLFEGASMILTPDADAPPSLLESLESLFLSIGFRCVTFSTPEDHDRIIAYTSQLAHVLSSAYVKSPTALMHRDFSAGSFADMTRVASLNEAMWTELFLLNRDFLADEVDALCGRLSDYSKALRAQDAQALKRLLAEGSERKRALQRD